MVPTPPLRWWPAGLVALALLASACPTSGPCTAGDAQACTCKSGGNGSQTCDGTGTWGECDCSGGSGGGTGTGGGTGVGGGNSTGSVTVTGTVTYDFVPSVYTPATGRATLQFASATQKPARGVVILVVQGTTTIGNSTTADNGAFSVSFTPGAGALTLYAVARTLSPAIQVQDNTSTGTPAWAISASLSGANQVVNLRATHGWTGTSFDAATRLAAPFAILDSMQTATRAFVAARPGLVFPALKCNWSPKNTAQSGDKTLGQIGTSHFSPAENQLYILGKDGSDTDEFDSHVIVHEWGHFFEANLSRSDSPGGQHGSGDVVDPRLAFGEGWGNAVASMVLPETAYADTSWVTSTLTGFGFDLETEPTPTDDPRPGPSSGAFSEFSVMRFLYDVFDSGSNEGFDGVALGLGPVIEVLTGAEKTTKAMTSVASFVAGLKATTAGGAASGAIDTLAAHYAIGAITTEWGDGDAQLRGMYTDVTALPFTSSGLALGGGNRPNTYQQNQYFKVTGTGGSLTFTTQASQDVDLALYQQGALLTSAATASGNETMSRSTTTGATYVLVLTGYGQTAGDYAVTVGVHQ